jgi:hypothetical protein
VTLIYETHFTLNHSSTRIVNFEQHYKLRFMSGCFCGDIFLVCTGLAVFYGSCVIFRTYWIKLNSVVCCVVVALTTSAEIRNGVERNQKVCRVWIWELFWSAIRQQEYRGKSDTVGWEVCQQTPLRVREKDGLSICQLGAMNKLIRGLV